VHQCFEAGGDDFISKPFHIDELLASMEALFRICPGLGVT
jgi:DNA-binding response OmpR family regulator